MSNTVLVILMLATLRIAYLIAIENGPYNILKKIRIFAGVIDDNEGYLQASNVVASMIICPLCNSIWIGITLTALWLITPEWTVIFLLPLALSAPVVLMEGIR